MAPSSRLTDHLVRAFHARWGRVGDAEVRAWKHSLSAMADVVRAAGLDSAGTGVELKLPLTDRRIDVFFVGESGERRPTVLLVELKQWESAAPSQFPDNVVVGGAERLHPSVQAASYAEYLRGFHSAFTEDGFDLRPSAYLHNMPVENAQSLRGVIYEGATAVAPFYVKGEEDRLARELRASVSQGDGLALLPRILEGRYRPSLKLIESLARSLDGNPVWRLLDEQRLAFNIVRGLAERAAKTGEKGAVVVTGGPGTGKSVIAVHLLVHLGRGEGLVVAHATGSKAFTTNLRALVPGGAAFFRYFNDFMPHDTKENAVDVLVCDEAHRIRKSSNDRFTKRVNKSPLSQTEELLRAARVSVFFLDRRQNVRPNEIGSVSVIEEAAARLGIPIRRLELNAQFRCNGCAAYVDWVDRLFSGDPAPAGGWLAAGDYDLRRFEAPAAMEIALKQRMGEGNTGRLVAGFCWPWSDPDATGRLREDVVIGEWRRPWNEKSPEQRKKPGAAPRPERHPYTLWATQADRVREVGCIYSAQGFEFDYCGVILGNDLVWREGTGWVASRDASRDPEIARRRLTREGLLDLLQHTYRVLMTRGMKGTFLYSTDWETGEMLRRLVGR
jgi:hypothetical protein